MQIFNVGITLAKGWRAMMRWKGKLPITLNGETMKTLFKATILSAALLGAIATAHPASAEPAQLNPNGEAQVDANSSNEMKMQDVTKDKTEKKVEKKATKAKKSAKKSKKHSKKKKK